MIEFIFRGKSLLTGEWLIGSLYNDGGEDYILPPELGSALNYEDYQVDQNTISPFSGKLDRDGTRIFHGDIVETEDGDRCLCIFRLDSGFKFIPDDRAYFNEELELYGDLKVVGNIWNNPEKYREFLLV